MRIAFSLMMTFLFASTTFANDESAGPMLGSWQLLFEAPPEKGCKDVITFNPDRTYSAVANDERQSGVYTLDVGARTSKTYRVNVIILKDNGGTDCSGDSKNDVGVSWAAYAKVEQDGLILTLYADELMQEKLISAKRIER